MDIYGILFSYLLENLYRDLYIFFLNNEKIEYNQNEILTNIGIKTFIDKQRDSLKDEISFNEVTYASVVKLIANTKCNKKSRE